MAEAGIYERAVTMCHEAYDADRTPASWRVPSHVMPEVLMATDASGGPACAIIGEDAVTFMGLPVEILRDKPHAVLTLITTAPEGPAGTLPPVIRS